MRVENETRWRLGRWRLGGTDVVQLPCTKQLPYTNGGATPQLTCTLDLTAHSHSTTTRGPHHGQSEMWAPARTGTP